MALVVLLSSFSLSFNKHICGDEVTAISLLTHIEKCEMKQMQTLQKGCHQAVPCCDDQTVLIDNDFEKTPALQSLSFEKQLYFIAYVFHFPFVLKEIQKPANTLLLRHPPPTSEDIIILHETFLI